MSEMRNTLQGQANDGAMVVKVIKWMGWLFVILGGLLTITVIGAPAGIPMIALGLFLSLFVTKMMAKRVATFGRAVSEVAEIHEHKLNQARRDREQ